MKLIFKITNYIKETNQIEVKFCRQNAPKPIDEYSSGFIDCQNLDFSNYETLVSSIISYGKSIIEEQEEREPTLPENIQLNFIESTNIEDYINNVICIDNNLSEKKLSYRMKKIEL